MLLRDNYGNQVTIKINSTDKERIKEMKTMNDLIECYNKTILNGNKLDSIWNVPYAVLLNHRLGKSIFNTNLTLFYHQHGTEVSFMEPRAKKLLIPIDEGYTIHVRSDFSNIFLNQRYPFSHFRLDVEFYQFVAYLNTI